MATSEQNKEEFIIREAQIDDAIYMQYINQVCLTENYPLIFWVKHIMKNSKGSFVAVNNKGLIVGYILTVMEPTRTGHIYSFGIFASYRRLGIGEKLIRASIDSCFSNWKVDTITLNVNVSNTAAICLYKKMGFEVVTKTEKYYDNGEDAYHMKLTSSSNL